MLVIQIGAIAAQLVVGGTAPKLPAMSQVSGAAGSGLPALNASIALRPAARLPTTSRQSQAHVRCWPRRASSTDAEAAELLRGPRRGRRASSSAGSFELRPGRRGHPHGDRAAADRDRRARSGASSTPRARATTRSRPTWRCSCASSRTRARERLLRADARRSRTWPSATPTGRCRATPTCSAPSPCISRTTCSRTSGCSAATSSGSPAPSCATADLPLGAGALAGVNWDTSRAHVARELGFDGVVENSLDAVSNRDFVLDYLSAASICAMHLSRLGAEIVLWSSEEFGFLELGDSFTSGSSIMPQKKNPDAAELLRAKAPRVAAHFDALLGVMHALPLAYNKDMQEDKEHLFDAVDTLDLCLEAATGMLRTASFRRERLAEAAGGRVPGRDRHRRPAGAPRRAVPRVARRSSPGLVRHALDERQAAVRAQPRRAGRLLRQARRRVLRGARRTARGSSRRCPRAAPPPRACGSSSSGHARCSTE